MEFKKIREGRYSLTLDKEVDDEIYNIINTLSLNEMSKYEDALNNRIYDTLISRRVASEFFKQGLVLPSIRFCIVEVTTNYFDKYMEVSVGSIPVEDHDVRVSGPLYI